MHNVQPDNLNASSNVTGVINSRRMRWVRHVAHMGLMKNAYNVWAENLKGRDHSEDLGVDGSIILVRILGK
jgi:hypothetical protein